MKSLKFPYRFVGQWRDGTLPKECASDTIAIVNYDQTSHAYTIFPDEYDDFQDWVAETWELERDPWFAEEKAADYLSRIGVNINYGS